MINPLERLGYPTQKPLKLIQRIVEASCLPEGLVLDPFCGCGTTVQAAQTLDRRWIGMDICVNACKVSFLQNCRPDRFFALSRLILLSRAWVSGPPRGMLCFYNNKIPRR